jgi:hypothetical protein
VILAAMLVFCCSTLAADMPRTAPVAPSVESKAISGDVASVADAKPEKPDAPSPKIAAADSDTEAEAEAVPSGKAIVRTPAQPATTESYETPRKRAIWYGLMAAGHGTAAFDAWTTRRAISGGYGVESDPFERPFAHSNALYATTQVSPLVMDFLGHYMMRSRYPMMRRLWWVPQTASASFSLGAGIHNYRVVH